MGADVRGRRSVRIAGSAVALVAVVSVIAGGCSSSKPSPPATTVDAFVSQANAVCRGMKEQGAALQATVSTAGSAQDGEAILDQALDQDVQILRDGVAGLRALTPPAAQAADVAAFEVQLDALVAASESRTAAIRSADQQAMTAAQGSVQAAQQAANEAATALGFTDCITG